MVLRDEPRERAADIAVMARALLHYLLGYKSGCTAAQGCPSKDVADLLARRCRLTFVARIDPALNN